MSRNICALLIASQLLLAGTVVAKSPRPPSVEQLIEHARDAVAAGTVDPVRDLAPLVEALAAATKAEDAHDLMNAIGDFGDYDRPRTLSMALIVKNFDAADVLIEAGARLSAEAAKKLLDGEEKNSRLTQLVKRARAK